MVTDGKGISCIMFVYLPVNWTLAMEDGQVFEDVCVYISEYISKALCCVGPETYFTLVHKCEWLVNTLQACSPVIQLF